MDEPSLLRVLVGANRLPNDQQQPSTLIVVAEDEQFKTLETQLARANGSIPVSLSHAVLAACPNKEVTWFRYNDSRINGVIPPEQLKPEYPNIELNSKEIFRATTLAELLNHWPASRDGEGGIYVTLSQGDPIEVLSGAGDWLQRIKRIKLESPLAKSLWFEAFDAWLSERAFKQDPQVPLAWVLDPLAAQLIRQQADIDALREQHQEALQLHAKREQELLAALQHIFPYSAYKSKRPDVVRFKNQDLVNHFVNHGIHEGVDLHFASMENELHALQTKRAEETSKLELLEIKTRQTAMHLELLKEMFARLMVNP
jgi:hypothetical protein